MEKKYKLVIPLDMLNIVPLGAKRMHNKTVVIINDNALTTIVSEPGNDTYCYHVKRTWLQEIKEPMTAEESYEDFSQNMQDIELIDKNRTSHRGSLEEKKANA